MANIPGTNLSAPARPHTTDDTYPTAYANEIKGGWHNIVSIAERDAIPPERREIGMAVNVDGGALYRLEGGLTNAHWAELSTQGPKGDKGDTGAQGAKGDKGDAGTQGAKGDKGDVGAAGPKGDKGDPGAQGAKGDIGNTGAQGPKGDKGDTGAQGATGPKGDKGDTGTAGSQGTPGTDGKSPYIGANGNWYTWNGTAFVDTGLNASQFILTNLAPGDAGFPTEVGKFTATTKGQAPVGGPPGESMPGAPGLNGADGADAPVPTPRVASVLVVQPSQQPSVSIVKVVDSFNPQHVYFDFSFILPQPIVEGGGSGGGLPEPIVVATDMTTLRNWSQVPGSYIIVPGYIEADDDWGIAEGVTLDGVGSGYIDGSDWAMFNVWSGNNVTLKNLRITGFDTSIYGRNVLIDNCKFNLAGGNGITFYGDSSFFPNTSYMVRNTVFNCAVNINVEEGAGGFIGTGNVFVVGHSEAYTNSEIVLIANIEYPQNQTAWVAPL